MSKKPKKQKKETRRSKNPYRALDPNLNLRSRWEEISDLASYANTLSPKDKEWLNKFSSEYVCADFGEKPLHKSKKMRKSVYDKNNSRNRCILTQSHAQGTTISLSEYDLDSVTTKANRDTGKMVGKRIRGNKASKVYKYLNNTNFVKNS